MSEEPTIDWKKIELPSGQITIEKVCEIEGLLADRHCFAFEKFGKFEINYILEAERALALRAYGKAAGLQPRNDGQLAMTRRSWLLELDARYQKYGISTGMEMTMQLVRRLEESATRLAQASRGTAL